MPALLHLAGEAAPKRSAVEKLGKGVEDALEAAAAAGYRIDKLLGEAEIADDDHIANLRDGERSIGDFEMPPLERDERDGPSPGHNLYAEHEEEPAGE
jgi:hypothetical protein